MEIDITEASIKEIEFIDNSKISVVNTTNYEVEFAFTNYWNNGRIDIAARCKLPPKSYRDTRDIVGKVREAFQSTGMKEDGERRIVIVKGTVRGSFGRKVKLGHSVTMQEGNLTYHRKT